MKSLQNTKQILCMYVKLQFSLSRDWCFCCRAVADWQTVKGSVFQLSDLFHYYSAYHDFQGWNTQTHMVRVYRSGSWPKRKSIQIPVKGKKPFIKSSYFRNQSARTCSRALTSFRVLQIKRLREKLVSKGIYSCYLLQYLFYF